MDDSRDDPVHALVIFDLLLVGALFVLLTHNLFGGGTAFASVSRPLLLAAWLFLGSELLVPVAVYLDIRRRPDDVDPLWIHAAAMPILNVFGVLAYLEDRRRNGG